MVSIYSNGIYSTYFKKTQPIYRIVLLFKGTKVCMKEMIYDVSNTNFYLFHHKEDYFSIKFSNEICYLSISKNWWNKR